MQQAILSLSMALLMGQRKLTQIHDQRQLEIPSVIGRSRYPERRSRLLLYWITLALTPEERRAWADSSLSQVYALSSSYLPSGATPSCYFRLVGMPEEEYLPGD